MDDGLAADRLGGGDLDVSEPDVRVDSHRLGPGARLPDGAGSGIVGGEGKEFAVERAQARRAEVPASHETQAPHPCLDVPVGSRDVQDPHARVGGSICMIPTASAELRALWSSRESWYS